MLVLLMQHEDGVTFTDTVCIGSFTAILPCISNYCGEQTCSNFFVSASFLMCSHYDFTVNISKINEASVIEFPVPSS